MGETKAYSLTTAAPTALPEAIADNMTINRLKAIERDILDLRDTFDRNLTAILMPSPPEPNHDLETANRTYLERSLIDVEIALAQLRRVAQRIAL